MSVVHNELFIADVVAVCKKHGVHIGEYNGYDRGGSPMDTEYLFEAPGMASVSLYELHKLIPKPERQERN